jgi:hypothetical protein
MWDFIDKKSALEKKGIIDRQTDKGWMDLQKNA